jgi:hypothetical protein
VTTTIGAVANATKLEYTDTVTSTTTAMTLNAGPDVTGLIAGTVIGAINTIGTNLSITATAGIIATGTTDALGFVSYLITDGVIAVRCAGSDGGVGRVRWFCLYMPLSAGAQIAAA